jgi:enoyl-CoA hydratase/carnithine racemase
MMLLGEKLAASEALSLGLLNRVVPAEELDGAGAVEPLAGERGGLVREGGPHGARLPARRPAPPPGGVARLHERVGLEDLRLLQLSADQQRVVDFATTTGRNVFVTGVAGCVLAGRAAAVRR